MDTPNGFSDEEADKMIQVFKDKDTGLVWHDDIGEVLANDGLPSTSWQNFKSLHAPCDSN